MLVSNIIFIDSGDVARDTISGVERANLWQEPFFLRELCDGKEKKVWS